MPQSKDELPVEWVSEDIIRKHFNDSQMLEKAESGESIEQAGEFVALAHRYLRPDGTLGASGLPDPKRMRLRNKIIATRTKVEDDE